MRNRQRRSSLRRNPARDRSNQRARCVIAVIRASARTEALAFDGETLWVQMPSGLLRVDPETGRTIASLDYPGVRVIAFANGSAWLTTEGEGVTELDLVTGAARRTIPVPGNALLPFVTGDTLWATDFNNSQLWRVDL